MDDLKDYHQHHQMDNDKIEYSANHNLNGGNNIHSTNPLHTVTSVATTEATNTNSLLNVTNELQSTSSSLPSSSSSTSSFQPIQGVNKKNTSVLNGNLLLDTSSLLPSTTVQLPPPPLTTSIQLGATPSSPPLPSLSSNSLIVTTASTLSTTGIVSSMSPTNDSQRLTETQHWYHHHHHHHPHPHTHHTHHSHHHHHPHNHLHPHQLEEQNFLVFGTNPNSNKLHDCSDGDYFNTRYNVKGIRSERTSSFFDIPAATHPYCYRFPSNPEILKKELEEERAYQSHASTLHLNQHYHHKIEYPDSTTNLNHHQNLTQTIPRTSPSDLHSFSSYNNSAYAAALRPADSTIVSSTEPEIGFGGLYPTCSPTLNSSLNQRRGSLQLWQFLVSLLDEPASSGCIAWTGKGMEFKLIEPEEVARRWGIQKNRPAMNYDKLSRSLRYYYEKGIMQKVAGERYVYKFVCAPEALFSMAYGHHDNNYTTNNNTNSSSSGNGSQLPNSNLSGSNINNKLNITTLIDEHQNQQLQHPDDLCATGKLNSLYYNNPLHNKF